MLPQRLPGPGDPLGNLLVLAWEWVSWVVTWSGKRVRRCRWGKHMRGWCGERVVTGLSLQRPGGVGGHPPHGRCTSWPGKGEAEPRNSWPRAFPLAQCRLGELYQATPRMGVVGSHSRHRSTVLGMLQLPGSDFTQSSLPPGSPRIGAIEAGQKGEKH